MAYPFGKIDRITIGFTRLILGKNAHERITDYFWFKSWNWKSQTRTGILVSRAFVIGFFSVLFLLVLALHWLTSPSGGRESPANVQETAKNAQISSSGTSDDSNTVSNPKPMPLPEKQASAPEYVGLSMSPFAGMKSVDECGKKFQDPSMALNCKDELATSKAVEAGDMKLCANVSMGSRARCVFYSVKVKATRSGNKETCNEIGKSGVSDVPEVYSINACRPK